MSEYNLHQTIMHAGGITGVMAKRIEEAVIAWYANDDNSLAYKCMELIKANAEVAEINIHTQDRVIELEDAMVEIMRLALNLPNCAAMRIREIIEGCAREKEDRDDRVHVEV